MNQNLGQMQLVNCLRDTVWKMYGLFVVLPIHGDDHPLQAGQHYGISISHCTEQPLPSPGYPSTRRECEERLRGGL